jgi:iron(III) transport system ATP-binding protein
LAADALPDDLVAHSAAIPETNGQVTERQYTGPIFIYRVELDDGTVVGCQHNHAEDFDVGERVRVDIDAQHPLAWYPD